jgi:hypothetical protein
MDFFSFFCIDHQYVDLVINDDFKKHLFERFFYCILATIFNNTWVPNAMRRGEGVEPAALRKNDEDLYIPPCQNLLKVFASTHKLHPSLPEPIKSLVSTHKLPKYMVFVLIAIKKNKATSAC